MFSIQELSTPAKVEALRYGHVALANPEELTPFLESISPFLEEEEDFSVKPFSSTAGRVTMFSIRIVPVAKLDPPTVIDF